MRPPAVGNTPVSAETAAAIKTGLQKLSTLGPAVDVYYTPHSQGKRPTKRRNALANITFASVFSLISAGTGLAALWNGFAWVQHKASGLSAAEQQYRQALSPEYQQLQQATLIAPALTPQQQEATFQAKLRALMNDSIAVLNASPEQDAQQTAEKMSSSVSQNPLLRGSQLSEDLLRTVKRHLQTQRKTIESASAQDYGTVVETFIQTNPAMRQLVPTGSEKEVASVLQNYLLSPGFKAKFSASANNAVTDLRETLTAVVPIGIQGVYLKDFQQIQSQEQTEKLFNTIFNNPNNYPEVENREQAKQTFHRIAKALHFNAEEDARWGQLLLLTTLAFAAGSTCSGGVVLFTGSGKRALNSLRFISSGQATRVLETRPTDQLEEVAIYQQAIDRKAVQMASLATYASQQGYLPEDSTHILTADGFYTHFLEETKKSILGASLKDGLVPLDQLYQKMNALMSKSFEEEEFLGLSLAQKVVLADPIRVFKEVVTIEDQIAEALLAEKNLKKLVVDTKDRASRIKAGSAIQQEAAKGFVKTNQDAEAKDMLQRSRAGNTEAEMLQQQLAQLQPSLEATRNSIAMAQQKAQKMLRQLQQLGSRENNVKLQEQYAALQQKLNQTTALLESFEDQVVTQEINQLLAN